MSANGMDSRTPYIVSREKGIATLLILVLVAIAISAAVLGTLRYVQGTQNQSLALNAQSRAQVVAWSGVELLLEYFQELTDPGGENDFDDIINELNTVLAENDEAIDISAENLKAQIVNILQVSPDLYRLTVDVTGLAGQGRAAASSTIQVIYELARGGGGGGCSPFCSDGPPSVITFNRDLRLSGSISVTTAPGQSYEVNVKGRVTTEGNSISGVDTINATDSIQIGSGSSYKNLRSNGDIAITGSVSVSDSMLALGNICVSGGTQFPGLTKANGFVYGTGSAGFGQIEARGASTYNGPYPQCSTYARTDGQGKLFGVWLAGNNKALSVKTSASVAHDSGTIQSLLAKGDLHITNGGSKVTSGTISGDKKRCSASNLNSCSGSVPSSVNVDQGSPQLSLEQLTPITVQVASFNAYDYESSANYVFKYDSDTQQRRVTVRNVNGISDGTYVLMPFQYTNNTYQDYLCSNVSGSTCLDDPASRKTICKTADALINNQPGKYQNWNACFSYQNGKWSVGGSGSNISIAQGVAWFEGDLEIKTGNFYNTFIATGNIKTSGQHKTIAPNFAGPNGGTYNYTIQHQWYAEQGSDVFKGICANAYFPHYPTQICNAFSANDPLPIANYAYLSGSVVSGNYMGGNVDLGASTIAYGSVLAGNEYKSSSGNVTVFGYISALGGGTSSDHSIGATTRIIVNQLPPTYIPMGGIDIGIGNEEGPGSTPPSVNVLWTRYL